MMKAAQVIAKDIYMNDLQQTTAAKVVESIADVKEADKTKLSRAYTFWILAKKNRPHPADPSDKSNQADSYESDLKAVATFDTVEDFWANYQYLCRPSTFKFGTSLHLVRIQSLYSCLVRRGY